MFKLLLYSIRSILDEFRIELMLFKNYKTEIRNMISIYLAKLDVRCASQVFGVNKTGIKLLEDYDWPENIRQFMRVINQLALTSKSPYISINEVKDAIKIEKRA